MDSYGVFRLDLIAIVFVVVRLCQQNFIGFQMIIRFFFPLPSISVIAVSMSGKINEVAAKHWQIYSRQQNIDNDGLFISTVFSMPILLNCMLMIVSRKLI